MFSLSGCFNRLIKLSLINSCFSENSETSFAPYCLELLMYQTFVEANKVQTKILTYGRRIQDSHHKSNEIIVVLLGIPGSVGFYEAFAKALFDKSGIPVWCIGHAGHNFPPKNSKIQFPPFEDHLDLYSLKGQIEHKIDFFRKYVPAGAKVHLVGHSVGAYIALEILDHPEVKNKVDDLYLLFPTIEGMASTRNGKHLNNFVRPLQSVLGFLIWIYVMLPNFLATILVYVYMLIMNIPIKLHAENIKEFLKPGTTKRALFMAFQKLDYMKERNSEVIKRNVKKIKFLYSKFDQWTEPNCWIKLKEDIPEVDVEVTCIDHTFVFYNNDDVAEKVIGWIKLRNKQTIN
ncbi:lipid droplet-associated hydrolase-like [Cylas formicarius]|uniref:lipid droplet-associated hydrolase-like n=1 Tax=Cylas formicarius TaxID=197179 RepID=UPI002958BFC7|nr:lipid droplet-associated hydrolase-like [Cylas formicarius]